jgi:hypothetical protein
MQLAEGESEVLPTYSVVDTRRAFRRFAVLRGGGELGFWAAVGQPLAGAPVAHLDAEGAQNRVLARDFEEFLGLLALGEPDPAALGKVSDEAREGYERYRAWLAGLGLTIPRGKAQAIVKKAEAEHPGLQDWLDGVGPEGEAVSLEALVAANAADALREALARGVDWSSTDTKQAVSKAIFKNRAALLDLLLAAGMPLELPLAYGNTPLLEAAAYGRPELVERLLAAGANPRARNASREGAAVLIAEFNAPLRRKLERLLGL